MAHKSFRNEYIYTNGNVQNRKLFYTVCKTKPLVMVQWN